MQFGLGQGDLGKQVAFGKQVVRHQGISEQGPRRERGFDLFEALGQKAEFHRKRVSLRVQVELLKKGVVGKRLQQGVGPKACRNGRGAVTRSHL